MALSRVSIDDLKRMTQVELDRVYGESEAGPIPNGDSKGTTLVFPESPAYEATLKQAESGQQWEGKIFYCPNPEGPGTLKNKVAGKLMLEAEVYYGVSAFDGRKCIVLDYAKAPEFQYFRFHDEMRRVTEDLYLGRMYRVDPQGGCGAFLLNFACDFKRTTDG